MVLPERGAPEPEFDRVLRLAHSNLRCGRQGAGAPDAQQVRHAPIHGDRFFGFLGPGGVACEIAGCSALQRFEKASSNRIRGCVR